MKIQNLIITSTLLILTACGGGSETENSNENENTTKVSENNLDVGNKYIDEKNISTNENATPIQKYDINKIQEGLKKISSAISQMESDKKIPILDKNSSLLGNDADSDGIRDDIQKWISNLNINSESKNSLNVLAKNLNEINANQDDDPNLYIDISKKIFKNFDCIKLRFENKYPAELIKNIVNYTFNTEKRYLKYLKFSSNLNGEVYTSINGLEACTQ